MGRHDKQAGEDEAPLQSALTRAPQKNDYGRPRQQRSTTNHGRPSARSAPQQAQRDIINVGVAIVFGNGRTRTCRFKWPSTINEEQAMADVLKRLRNDELTLVSEIHMSQAPRRGGARIEWLDAEPLGNYYMNQDLYGENGTMSQMASLNNMNLDYNPDDLNNATYNQDSLAGYTQDPRNQGHAAYPVDPRMATAPQYNANDVWGAPANQPPPPQFLSRRY